MLRYCSYYLKKIECTNKDCLFLHKIADKNDIIHREDLNGNKNIFVEQQLYAIKIADLYNPEVKSRLMKLSEKRPYVPVLPSSESVYFKNIVKENDPIYQKNKIAKKKYFEDNSNDKSRFKTNSSVNKEIYILKLNQVIDNFNDSKKSRYSPNSTETTSTSSKEDLQYPNSGNEEKITISAEKLKIDECSLPDVNKSSESSSFKLFSTRPCSRFNFVKSSNNYENLEIPQFILNLIFKKSSTYKLSKNMSHLEDILYSDKILETEYKNKNPWAQFILDNKSETNHEKKIDKENEDKKLIEDFDQINYFIFNKFKNINKNNKN